MPPMTTVSLLMAGAALAHYPHDPAVFMAVSPEPAPTWVISTIWRTEAWMIARTQNDADIDIRYIRYGEGEEIKGGEMLGVDRLVIVLDGLGLWTSDDAGDTWTIHDDIPAGSHLDQVVASPDVLYDGVALVVGNGGVWRTSNSGESWSQVATMDGINLVDVSMSPDWTMDGRACAVSEAGDVYCSQDAGFTWTWKSRPTQAAWNIAVDQGSRIWLGTAGDGLLRSDDGAASWIGISGFESEDVSLLAAFGDGLVMATTLTEAVFRSDDGGESWLYCNDYLEITSPQPLDGNHYFEFKETLDGDIYLAAWEGVLKSQDRGLTWNRIETALMQAVRGLAMSRGTSDGDPIALLGLYGGGAIEVDSDTTTAKTISHDLNWRFPRSLATTTDWPDDRFAILMGSGSGEGSLYATYDGGETWDAIGAELSHPAHAWMSPDFTQDPFVAISSGTGSAGTFAISEDAGQTFVMGNLDQACDGPAGGVMVSWAWDQDGMVFGSCNDEGAVYVSQDRGVDWTRIGSAGSTVNALAATPNGEKLFLASNDGLFLSSNLGPPSYLAFAGKPVWGVAVSPDWEQYPWVYAIVVTDGWYRSTDGGDTWEKLDAPSADIPLVVSVSPDFAQDGVVAVSTYGGAWVSHDRGLTWSVLHVLELHQQEHPTWTEDGTWNSVFDDQASGGSYGESSTPGDFMLLRFRGEAVDLLAPIWPEGGTMSVQVDDQQPQTVSLFGDQASKQVVFTAHGLPDDRHELLVQVEEGTAAVDAALVWRVDISGTSPQDTGASVDTSSPETGTDTGTSPSSRCGGCSAARNGKGLLVWLLLLSLARRRKGTRHMLPRKCGS